MISIRIAEETLLELHLIKKHHKLASVDEAIKLMIAQLYDEYGEGNESGLTIKNPITLNEGYDLLVTKGVRFSTSLALELNRHQ